LIEVEDIEELLRGFTMSVPNWCAKSQVDEDALLLVARTYGSDSKTGGAVVCAFQLGYEARKMLADGRRSHPNPGGRGQ
jgi:hypothetical protein